MNVQTTYSTAPVRSKLCHPGAVFVGCAVRIPERVEAEYIASLCNGVNVAAQDIAAARHAEYDMESEMVRTLLVSHSAARGLVPTRGTLEVIEYIEANTGDTMKLYRMPFRDATSRYASKPMEVKK